MSEENVEVVRQLSEHWERGDWVTGRELFDHRCELVFSVSGFPDPGLYRYGRDSLRAWSGFVDAFDEFDAEVEEIVEAGELVVAFVRIRCRGRASGADIDARAGNIFTFREGKIVRWVLTDRSEALEAVGLSE